jgi:hypothetical protein
METITLNNGIIVEVNDKTVVLAGDMYMVHLEFTTVAKLDEADAELREYCGGELLRKTRVFKKPAVLKRKLDEVKKAMKDSYLASTTPYLGRPRFIERFKAKALEEFREEEVKAQRRLGGYEERE